jgi:dihydropyrimidinase
VTRILITGGDVISATGSQRNDLLIDGEEIAALGAPGFFDDVKSTCDRVLDARGKYVLPGGVDVHTHMELPFGGTAASDTFETGTIAAAFGGTTSIVDFAVQRTGEDVHDGLAAWHLKADGNCAIDYGFHQIIGGVDDAALKAMADLTNNEGVTSFKLFMAYPGVFYSDDGQILRAMQTAADLGATIMMHAENGPAIDVLVAQALERGETDPRYHSLTRPVEMEEEATHRAIMLAKVANCPLYIVHVSAREAVETIARARGMGANVFAETCPQYLYLSLEEHLSRPGFEGAAYVCSTPLRSRAEGHPFGREYRPLPVLHEGSEGTRPRELLQDSQRHWIGGAPDGPALPGCRDWRDRTGALGRVGVDDARADVRPLSKEGCDRGR